MPKDNIDPNLKKVVANPPENSDNEVKRGSLEHDRERGGLIDGAISETDSRRSRESDSPEQKDAVRLSMRRDEFLHNVLPDLPKIPGYHCCWLSTTNQSDSIQNRMRLGYVPLKKEDIVNSGYEMLEIKEGQYEGYIGCREMIAFKLPKDLYEHYMEELHHIAPNEEDEKLNALVEDLKRKMGPKAKVEVEEGMINTIKRKPLFND